MSENEREPVVWLPVLDLTGGWLEAMPLSTFGTATDHEGVPVPEADGAVIDTGIAELVALLNRAGVETVQSCHDVSGGSGSGRLVAEDGDEDEIVVRLYEADDDTWFGCIVVQWDQFPKVGRLLPGGPWPDALPYLPDGWLFTASPNARYMSILFPWRDLERFTASVRAASAE